MEGGGRGWTHSRAPRECQQAGAAGAPFSYFNLVSAFVWARLAPDCSTCIFTLLQHRIYRSSQTRGRTLQPCVGSTAPPLITREVLPFLSLVCFRCKGVGVLALQRGSDFLPGWFPSSPLGQNPLGAPPDLVVMFSHPCQNVGGRIKNNGSKDLQKTIVT